MTLKNDLVRIVFWTGLIYAIAALMGAYSAEFLLNIHPCLLCLYQRGVLFAVAIIGLALLISKKDISKIYLVFPFLYMLSFGIATYHSGIEAQIFPSPKQCQGSLEPTHNDVDMLRRMLLKKKMPPCDSIPWHLFGLTMANYNALASLSILVGWGVILSRRRRIKAPE